MDQAAGPIDRRALCVALHDVAPSTWPACAELLAAIRQVADIPLTLLVVPHYHGSADADAAYEQALTALALQGHELALHGYTHLDDAPPGGSWRARFLRGVYTTGEGEFSALDADAARQRIALGLAWFGQRGWRPAGFVPPAWLLSPGAWQALTGFDFAYTTTWRHFHFLPSGQAVQAPALVYAARNRSGRLLSPPLAGLLALAARGAPLVRVALHPADARHPALVRHAQQLIGRLLDDGRVALSKAAFAARWAASGTITSTDPNSRRTPSGAGQSLRDTRGRNAGSHPSR